MGSSKSKEKKPKNQEAEKEKSKEDVQKEETEEEKAQKKKFAPVERTLVVIKPDAVAAGKEGDILQKLEESGFIIIMEKTTTLSKEEASEFYKEHSQKEFFDKLVEFMSSGPCHALILSKVDAMKEMRTLMGPTDSEEARQKEPATFRALYGTDTLRNAIHASETPDATAREIDFFFPGVSS